MQKLFSYITICITSMLVAQQTQVNGIINTITTPDGLHKIQLPSAVRSYAHANIDDFRILNANNEQVPYFTHRDANETRVSDFKEFEMVSQQRIPDSSSTYIFKNPEKSLKQVVLSIANYDGSKRIRLEGSDDKKEWFGLVNKQWLYNLKSSSTTSIYKVLGFPLTSYRYIKIVFDDHNSLPINLRKIGTAKTILKKEEWITIPKKELTTSELQEERKTLLHVLFEHPQLLHQINFEIVAPEFYNRKVRVYTLATRTVKNKKETYKKYMDNFILRSDGAHRFPLTDSLVKELYIEIENQDNPKLQIAAIDFMQEPLYVIADLKKGEEYHVTAGDKMLKKPSYDLSYFKNRISKDLPKATITNVVYKTPEEVSQNTNTSFWQQSWFMWTCIGISGVLVAYFATSLIEDMKKNID